MKKWCWGVIWFIPCSNSQSKDSLKEPQLMVLKKKESRMLFGKLARIFGEDGSKEEVWPAKKLDSRLVECFNQSSIMIFKINSSLKKTLTWRTCKCSESACNFNVLAVKRPSATFMLTQTLKKLYTWLIWYIHELPT